MNASRQYQIVLSLLGGPAIALMLVGALAERPRAFLQSNDVLVTFLSLTISVVLYKLLGTMFTEIRMEIAQEERVAGSRSGECSETDVSTHESVTTPSAPASNLGSVYGAKLVSNQEVDWDPPPEIIQIGPSKVIVRCPHCSGKLRIPTNRHISVTCNHCRNRFTYGKSV